MQNKPVKKIPERHCVGCSKAAPKSDLIRVVRSPEGEVSIDFKGKKSGRGVYICQSADCLKKALKAKRLEHNLNIIIPPEIFAELEEVINRGDDGEEG